MEAKLAEYRAKKRKEQRQKDNLTLSQRIFGLFRRTDSTDSNRKKDEDQMAEPASPQQQSPDSPDTSGCDAEEEEEEFDPPPQKYRWLLLALKAALWCTVWLIFIELQFGAVFFTISALVFVYWNTRTGRRGKKASLSAYSVFNPNCERLQGTITAEQFEAELLHRKPLAQS
ncbi:uncharacterized protein LOC143295788 [Babylonia areolata]|uniref:uncharacterized protein LOC143295788 n=1 Tax=Babylonia areolata TaxID=304850 RepID=UPI003FD5713E